MTKILFAVIVVIAIAVAFTRYQGGEYKKFLATAKTVDAKVTLRVERENGQKNRRIEKILEYRFVVDGNNYTGSDTVEFDDLWARVKKNDEITVYYDPQNPNKNFAVALLDRRVGLAEKLESIWPK